MRFISKIPFSLLAALSICACSTVPKSGLPEPVAIKTEQESTTQIISDGYPMLYPSKEIEPVPICERFVSSISAAERKLADAGGGYQPYQLYIP